MDRPEKVKLHCPHCGHDWLEPTGNLLALKVVVYRDESGTVRRHIRCPNCDKWVIVKVPEAWLQDE